MKRFLTFIIFLLAAQINLPTVRQVPGTYSTIQGALNSCITGDTVLVAPGTYYENILWPATHSIYLKSDSGAVVTIIDGGAVSRVITINSGADNTTVIDGFTIKNGYMNVGGGIGIAYSSPTIKNNIITNNVGYETVANFGGGGGIAAGYNSSPVIVDNIIKSNQATASAGGGFSCALNSNPVIHNNIFENNSAATGGGALLIHDGCSATITNNLVRFNTSQNRGGGMYFQASACTVKYNVIEYNTADSTGGGIEFGLGDQSLLESDTIRFNTAHLSGGGIGMHDGPIPTISKNIIINNTADYHGGGMYIRDNSNPVIKNNLIFGNEADSTGGGINCNRGSSPVIEDNTIEANISYAAGGGGICVAYGSSPQIKNNQITDCQANGNSGGGGIFVVYNSNPIIQDNTITNNSCDLGGGGILVYVECAPHILGNIVNYNSAGGVGGGLALQTSTSKVRFNRVEYNISGTIYSSGGAGIWSCWSDQSVIDSNYILENEGDGIFCAEGSTPLISGNNICGNKGFGVNNIDPSVTVNAKNNWWDNINGPGGAGPGTGDSVSAYVDYYPWLPSPMPVELTSFSAKCIAGEVMLNWTTATEVNNRGFEIERRIINKAEQSEWVVIGFKKGNGTTTEVRAYSFSDNITGIMATSLLYRLKQIDFDGSYKYSSEIIIENLAPVYFFLNQNYPNPFNPSTTVSYGVPFKSHVVLKIYNALGKEIKTLVDSEMQAGGYEIQFNVMGLPSGVYFYQLKAGSFIETRKMILLK